MANVWLRLYEITGAHVSGASPYGPRCTSSRLVVWARCDRHDVHWRPADSRRAESREAWGERRRRRWSSP